MLDQSQLEEHAETPKSPSVTYELYRECGPNGVGPWCVGSVKVAEAAMSHEVKFRETRELLSVVGEDTYRFFEDYLPTEPKMAIVSAKSAQYQDGQISLKGICVTAFDVSKFLQRCLLIITEYKGSLIKNISESSFITNIFQMRDTLISKVVGDILLPMINLSNMPDGASLNADAQRRVEDFMALLRTENGKLNGCLEYLINYVNDSPINTHQGSRRPPRQVH